MTTTTNTEPTSNPRGGLYLVSLKPGAQINLLTAIVDTTSGTLIVPLAGRVVQQNANFSVVLVALDPAEVESYPVIDLEKSLHVILWHNTGRSATPIRVPGVSDTPGYIYVADVQPDGRDLTDPPIESAADKVDEEAGEQAKQDEERDAEAIEREPEDRDDPKITRPIEVFKPAADLIELAMELRRASYEFGTHLTNDRFALRHDELCDVLDRYVGYLTMIRVTVTRETAADAPNFHGTPGEA